MLGVLGGLAGRPRTSPPSGDRRQAAGYVALIEVRDFY